MNQKPTNNLILLKIESLSEKMLYSKKKSVGTGRKLKAQISKRIWTGMIERHMSMMLRKLSKMIHEFCNSKLQSNLHNYQV